MSTQESLGANLQGGAEEARKEAARLMGQVRSERKTAAARVNGEKRRGQTFSEEHKARLREAQKARREREALAAPVVSVEKRPPGRPRKAQAEQTTETAPQQKRGRGRPRKAEQATLPMETPQEGA